MAIIMAVRTIRLPEHGVWLILSCGHRYKWTGRIPPPPIGETIHCPDDSPIIVETETP